MGLPEKPVTISPIEVGEINKRLATLRHNVNNHLSLVIAATEVIRRKPDLAPRILETLSEQPQRIVEEIKIFSEEIERMLQITREPRS